jgi:ATP-dependent protease HslVU (ClpYQ) peptidase subunit
MTVLLGVRTADQVFIGADAWGQDGAQLIDGHEPKVVQLAPRLIVASTGSVRIKQVLFHCLEVPRLVDGDDELVWMVKEFVPALKRALEEHGCLNVKDVHEWENRLLVGLNNRMFVVDCGFAVVEPVVDAWGEGSGGAEAVGAATALAGQEPEERIREGIRITALYTVGIGGKVTVLST